MGENFPEDDAPLPPNLRFLRVLVTVLTAVMILGVITIVVLLVIRLSDVSAPVFVHPDAFAVPEGVGLVGYSVVNGHVVLVGDDGVIRVFSNDTQVLVEEIRVGD